MVLWSVSKIVLPSPIVAGCVGVAAIRGVSVSQVQPKRSVTTEHTPYLPEPSHQLCHILLRSLFQTELTWHPVIAKAPVGRAGHAAVVGGGWECSQLLNP